MAGEIIETLPGGTHVYTWEGQKITTDSLLLAAFCPVQARWSVCDLGCGSGLLLLSLVDRGITGRAVGVELDAHASALLQQAITLNQLPQANAVCGNLIDYRTTHLFDMVVSNPPYFNSGRIATAPHRALARHQISCSIYDVCAAARRLLKDKGRFCLCWPAQNIADLFRALDASHLEPKRMQMVRKCAGSEARLVLLEARKAAGQGITCLPDLLLDEGKTTHF